MVTENIGGRVERPPFGQKVRKVAVQGRFDIMVDIQVLFWRGEVGPADRRVRCAGKKTDAEQKGQETAESLFVCHDFKGSFLYIRFSPLNTCCQIREELPLFF